MELIFNFWKYSMGPKEKVWMGQVYLYYLPVFIPVLHETEKSRYGHVDMEISKVLSGSLQNNHVWWQKKAADDVSARSSMIVHSQLIELSDKILQSANFKSVSGEMEKYPKIQKSGLGEMEKYPKLQKSGCIISHWAHFD